MNELIESIRALKAKARESCDLTSPHVGCALSSLDSAAFCLANEQQRLADLKPKEAAAPVVPAAPSPSKRP